MSRTARIIIAVVIVGAIAATAGAVWFFSQSSGEASQDISQVVSTLPPTVTRETAEVTSEPTSEATSEAGAEATAEADSAVGGTEGSANAGESAGAVVFEIVPDESEARFVINEILVGQPKEVVGVTNQVGGQLLIDFNDPSASQIGEIIVNVRTLTTDNEMRNRSIRSMILQTNIPDNEFARFTPTALNGLPESITFGTPIDFTITGDLTIKGTTNSVTFDVTVTPVSNERIEGLATLTFDYERDFGIVISQLPMQVASVEETVRLELDFVAAPVAE